MHSNQQGQMYSNEELVGSDLVEGKQGRTQGVGWGVPGCSPLKPPKTEILKTDFVDIMILKVLRDFTFSRNQPLKLADD
jgi:hypothetical protein